MQSFEPAPCFREQIMDRYELSLHLSAAAGKLLLELQKAPEVSVKRDNTMVTQADIAINHLFTDEIGRYFPGDTVIGEEYSYFPPDQSDFRWIIDPIDGTSDFIRGGNSNGVAVALQTENELQFGTFYNPSREELFSARKDCGAELNGYQIHVNSNGFEAGVGYDYCYWEGAPINTPAFDNQLGAPLGQYSISNQACRVAQGVSAFTVFPGVHPHDILPGLIIVSEAGGVVTNRDGQSLRVCNEPYEPGTIYSNQASHDDIVQYIRDL